MRSLLVMVVVVAACGNDGKDGIQPKTDAATAGSADAFVDPFRDAPATTTVQVTVSGKVTAQGTTGSTPLTGVTIVAYRNSDTDENMPLGMTTSDGAGNYTLTAQTNGESIDGYLKASRTGYLDTYLYPPYPLTMDFSNASVLMVSQGTFETLITSPQGKAAARARASSDSVVTDGTTRSAGRWSRARPRSRSDEIQCAGRELALPSTTATMTHTDGVAYLFNAALGQVTVSATHPSMTLASHGLKVRADVLTTTVIVP